MVLTTATGWRRALAAALVLATLLAGAGRAAASAADPDRGRPGPEASALRILGLRAPICHAGGATPPASDAPSPDAPAPADCCGACALLAPATLPSAPAVPARVAVALHGARAPAAPPTRALPRQRGPRQSRGPPRG